MFNAIAFRSLGAGAAAVAIAAMPGAVLADQYKISFATERGDDDGALRRATVEAVLTLDRNRIRMIRAAEDTGLYQGWAGFLTGIEAVDARGEPVALILEAPGVWRVGRRVRGEIFLNYTMNLQHDRFANEPGDDELAYARSYGVMWTTRALLMEGAAANDIRVEFDLPEGWKVSTPWKRQSEEAWVFKAKDNDDLLDGAFMAGMHDETVVDMGNAKAFIALGPPVSEMGAMFEPLIQGFFGAYQKLFDDAPKDNFLLIGGDASFLGGGVMGRTISLSLNEDAKDGAAQFIAAYIISHEGFHLWNSRWGGQNQNLGELEWLSEGAAEYYAFLTSLRLGLVDEETFLGLIAERYGAYLGALASGDSLVSAAATKNSASASYDLIYNGGMSVLFYLDLEIRGATGGAKSLDDVIRVIHQNYDDGAGVLSLATLRKTIRTETGVDIGDIIRRHIRGNEAIDVAGALAKAGLSVTIEEGDEGPVAQITRASPSTPEQAALYQGLMSGE